MKSSTSFATLFAFSVLLVSITACGSASGSGSNPPPASPTITAVSVSCTPTSITATGTSSCAATVTGTGSYSSAVTWTATNGTITFAGVFTPKGTGSAQISATSTQDSTKSGSAAITVAMPTILSVLITDLPTGASSSVKVTDPNGKTIQLTSSQTLSAIPGAYTVTAAPVVFGASTYHAIITTQTANITSGNTTTVTVDYYNVIPNTTKILDQAGLSSLEISPDGNTLTMSGASAVASSLKPGDLIVVPPTPAGSVAPMGLLRKVLAVSSSNSQIVATTQQGTLADAFERLNFQLQTQLTSKTIQSVRPAAGATFHPGASIHMATARRALSASGTVSDPCNGFSLGVFDVSKPINSGIVPGLTLNGQVELCSGLNFSIDLIGQGFLGLEPKLNAMTASATMGEYSDITLQGTFLQGSFDPSPIQLGTLVFPPIDVPGLPIWVTPQVGVFVGADGSLSSGISTEMSSSGTFSGGVSYGSGSWSPIPLQPSLQFAYTPPTLDASLSAKAYAGVQFDLYVYDIVGPSFKPDGYLALKADISQDPWWTLTGGLEGPMSFDITILGDNLASYDLGTMFDYSKLIASASGPFLPTGKVTVSPSTAQVSVGSHQQFAATVTGISNSAVYWSVNGSIGGDSTVGTISASGLYTAPASVPSATTVTVTATSQADASVSGSASLTIEPSGTVTISPQSASVPEGGTQTFTASVSGGGGVAWSVREATGGTITSAGVYTAPSITGTFNVIATSVADSSQKATATVTVVPGPIITTLHSFNHATEGANPWSALILGSDGNFYGTTEAGGDLSCSYITSLIGCGTVFKMDASGNTTVLHAFSGQDGAYPAAQLLQGQDGGLYGTTVYGGHSIAECLAGGTSTPAGCGTIFQINASGTFNQIYSFSSFTSPEGIGPDAALIQASDGRIYGATVEGGNTACRGTNGSTSTLGCGSIFTIDASGALATLHSFSGSEGAYPETALLQDTDGNFYGTTTGGGNSSCSSYATPGCGTVFRMTAGGDVANLRSFNQQDGAFPYAALIRGSDGDLYGTTIFGGSAPCTSGAPWQGCGVAFKIDTAGNFKVLHNFAGPDGAYPAQLIQASDGYFYGTTEGGGDAFCTGRYGPGCGTVFRMDAAGNVTIIYAFTGQSDGSWPESALLQGKDGNLYGTTVYGGTTDDGVVFRISNLGSLNSTNSQADVAPEDRPQVHAITVKRPHVALPLMAAPTVRP